MRDFRGQVAAITGAASGIGRALSIELAQKGCHLALSDVDEVGLARTADLCGTAVNVTTSIVDVSGRDDTCEWAEQVVADHGKVNVIVNNAGVNLIDNVADQSLADVEWVMDIDFWGVVHGTQAFLPHLIESGDGHVVNISSVFGLLSIPSQSAYNAAKFAVRGYTDALRMELELEGAAVSATTIHPGGIKTNIVRNGRAKNMPRSIERFDKIARTTPQEAARQIVKAVERGRRRALIGPDAKAFDLVSRLPASASQRIVMATARRALRSESAQRSQE